MHIYARESVSGTHVFPLSVLCNSYNSVLQLWCNLQNKPVQPSGLTTNVLNLTKINTSNILGIILCHYQTNLLIINKEIISKTEITDLIKI